MARAKKKDSEDKAPEKFSGAESASETGRTAEVGKVDKGDLFRSKSGKVFEVKKAGADEVTIDEVSVDQPQPADYAPEQGVVIPREALNSGGWVRTEG